MPKNTPPNESPDQPRDPHQYIAKYRRLAARAVELAARIEGLSADKRGLERRLKRVTETNQRLKGMLAELRRSPDVRTGRIVRLLPWAVTHPRLAAERLRARRERERSGALAGTSPSVADHDETPPRRAWGEPTVTRSSRRLPSGDAKVSVVVPVYNGLEVTTRCIESIYAARCSVAFEVIVVDNASSDGIGERLEEDVRDRANFTLVRNPENRGFAGAVNEGASFASGETILICNNDVVLTDGALDRLYGALMEDDHIGVVSPVTNYVGEGPQIDGAAQGVGPSSAGWYAETLEGITDIEHVPDRLVFFCVLVRRSLFEMLGGLSDAYGMGNFEDDDFSIRARLAGFTLAVHRGAFAFHHGSYTFKAHGVSHTDWMSRNRRVFYDRLAELSTTRGAIRVRPPDADVSVIVRTMDRPRELREALQSLVNQTIRPQVVVVNDGGPPVEDVIADFTHELEISSVRHDRPKGRGGALNAGIAAAGRRWISFLDDDDILYPAHLEVLLDGVEQSGFPVAYGQVDKVLYRVENDTKIAIAREGFGSFEFDPQLLLAANRITIHSFVAPRDLVCDVGSFDEKLPMLEDWEFLIRLSRRVPFCFVRRTTCEYRFLVGGTVANSVLTSRAKSLQAAEEIHARYPVEDEQILRRRKVIVDGLREQVEILRTIQMLDVSDDEKTLMALERLKVFQSLNRA